MLPVTNDPTHIGKLARSLDDHALCATLNAFDLEFCLGPLKNERIAQQCAEVSELDQFANLFAQIISHLPSHGRAFPCSTRLSSLPPGRARNTPFMRPPSPPMPSTRAPSFTALTKKLWIIGVQILGQTIDIDSRSRCKFRKLFANTRR
jgi:hypothetical protein